MDDTPDRTNRGSAPDPVRAEATVERKEPSLPAFVVLDAALFNRWRLSGTTVVEMWVNGRDIGRRSLKRWSEREGWFVDLTAKQLHAAAVDVGDQVDIELRKASTTLPDELHRFLIVDEQAQRRWSEMSDAERRLASEHVREAKRPATRLRRARKALGLDHDPAGD